MQFTATIIALAAAAGSAIGLPTPQEAAAQGDNQWVVSQFTRFCDSLESECKITFTLGVDGIRGNNCELDNIKIPANTFEPLTCPETDIQISASYHPTNETNLPPMTVFNIVLNDEQIWADYTDAELEAGAVAQDQTSTPYPVFPSSD